MKKPRRIMPRRVPPIPLCRCRAFCLEDVARTGRVCRLEARKKRKMR